MKQMSLMVCLCLLVVGCSETPDPGEAVAAKAESRLPADLAISEKPLDEPLTADEVMCFIDLVKSLPGGKLPEFGPLPEGAELQVHSTEAAIEAWRTRVREALTVDTLMQGWAPRSTVRRTLSERRIQPRSLTSLMLRMSCALAAEGMGGSRMVAAQRVIADEQVGAIIVRIHKYESSRTEIPQALWQSLEEAASVAEYLSLLSTVPPESLELVAEYKTDLRDMLPASSNLTTLPESHEESHITPINFDEPIKPIQPKRR